MNKPLALSHQALKHGKEFVCNGLLLDVGLDTIAEREVVGLQEIDDDISIGPVEHRTDFRNMEHRVPQYAFPGACWHPNGNGEYTIERRNVGHLGCIDSPDCSKFLRGLYESADC